MVTARAYPNIALVKYWGKRDEELVLPVAGSLSLTLDAFATTTTVTTVPTSPRSGSAGPGGAGDADHVELNGQPAEGDARDRVVAFLDLVRDLAGSTDRARVISRNEAPTAAGLASSASGFAALALAASTAYGLDLETPALSRLARRGSGSAARSIVPNVAIWHAGEGDETSFAEPAQAPEMAMVIVTVDATQKAVSSREAMRRTAATSPAFETWALATEQYLEQMVAACASEDFTQIGELTEAHALLMHRVIGSCDPPIKYLLPESLDVFDAVADLRDRGLEAYFTADAGPNVAVLVRPQDADAVAAGLAQVVGAQKVRAVGAGPGAHLLADG